MSTVETGNFSEIVFEVNTKAVLNSNRMPANVHVKSSMASKLRTMGQRAGVDGHVYPEFARSCLDEALLLAEMNTVKSRIRKRMRKSGGFTESEIDVEIEKALNLLTHPDDENNVDHVSNGSSPEGTSDLFEPDYMFKHFVVMVEVLTPTRRRCDPPNLYPTVKALVDGLTDSGWWEDDDYSSMVEMAFRHGGLSNIKDTYKIVFHIKEVSEDFLEETASFSNINFNYGGE